jgi:hypothetical protein
VVLNDRLAALAVVQCSDLNRISVSSQAAVHTPQFINDFMHPVDNATSGGPDNSGASKTC